MDDKDIQSYSQSYKIKLDASHSPGYVVAAGGDAGDGGIANAKELAVDGNLNVAGQVFFDLPAMNTKSTRCLMRLKCVTIPSAQYTLRTNSLIPTGSDPVVNVVESDYESRQGNKPIFYVTANCVSNKSFMSYPSGEVGLRDILGSINITSLLKHSNSFDLKESLTAHEESSYNNVIDDTWVLCNNPFGTRLHLNLINSDGVCPNIKCSLDGLAGEGTKSLEVNKIINGSLVYELEVKLLETL